jgi:hypothetical protein
MVELATRRLGVFDQITAEGWFTTQVLTTHGVYLPIRTHDAFLIALMNAMPWNLAKMECIVLLLVTDEGAIWEGVQLLRASLAWARMRKAASWHYWWDEGDAGVLARRLGAKLGTPRYRIDL